MSILSPGSKCHLCSLVDFLPFICPTCNLVYCQQHISSNLHTCTQQQLDQNTSIDRPGNLERGKTICEMKGCDRESIESIGGFVAEGEGEGIAREVRCRGCGGAYCVEHRSQSTHSCTAPLDHNVRHDAFLERRDKAREIISQRFPDFRDRVIPKPPPGKDVVKTQSVKTQTQRKEDNRTTELSKSSSGSGSGEGICQDNAAVDQLKPKIKSKADRLWDIHLKKIRMTAEPLLKLARNDSMTERVFFEWTMDLMQIQENVRKWKESGKWSGGKLERGWVDCDMPIGKMLDLITGRGKIKRSEDQSQSLHLLSLYPAPDEERQVIQLELSKSAKMIPQGSLVVLVRGGWNQGI
ncbi:hypothetical protein I203_107062 [Kwoniella mangroviensis CBS 8507]|uniref:hypothetical protein n=1 Tax=Kwoniella mangroviensis CBS 8507 TaxID=1296122 RepID=UPI00080D0A38|nr:uncharacterized protein I203_01809 [Kwoniella mangroviensis CBS 8507]OCF68427.1 hypothetical protein I203_01809 [Kwoniella mangroviensis CBS 8507]